MKRPRFHHIVIATGVGVLVAGTAITLAPWYDAARWQTSPEAVRALRNADAPTLVPQPPRAPTALSRPVPTIASLQLQHPAPTAEAPRLSHSVGLEADIEPPSTPTLGPSELQLTSAEFAFDDPPQPGAHAHLSVTLLNPTDQVESEINLELPTAWLAGYQLLTTTPPLAGGRQDGNTLSLAFPGPGVSSTASFEVSFVTTDEVIDSPAFMVLDGEGRTVAQAHPPTVAPPPRPGPIYSIDIPRLKLHSGVVPVDWEPPLFVVGQVRASAYVTQGNSVLVGHVRGAAGYNVFDRLDELEAGDEVIANSRGQAYDFVVTQTEVLPADDTSPTDASRSPRLTLMTCTGDWDPISRSYPDRLWVIAEPVNSARPLRGPD